MPVPTFGVLHDFRQALPHSLEPARYYAECLDQVVRAERLGFDTVWFGEHHFTADGFLPSPLVAAAAVAARTSRIGIGTNILVLPLHHPLRVAEDAAVVELLSDGRLVLGVGQGYAEDEFAGLGADRGRRGALLEEGIGVLRQAWDDGVVTGADGRTLTFAPRPARRVPILVGAVAPRAVDRAVRLADGMIVHASRITEHRPRWDTLDAALTRHRRLRADFTVIGSTVVHVDDDSVRAWATATRAMHYYEHLLSRADPAALPTTPAVPGTRADYLVGTPPEVAERMVALLRTAPYDHLCFWGRLPGLDAATSVRSLELFAREVRPPVEAALATVKAPGTAPG